MRRGGMSGPKSASPASSNRCRQPDQPTSIGEDRPDQLETAANTAANIDTGGEIAGLPDSTPSCGKSSLREIELAS